MDKNWKLQRYNRKDYSEIVEFPVEIVGRDGVVRRYSFEDSIRLYQRRITFAAIRYRDGELVEAEANHCRSRIDQLRRSYFHRYGWGTPEGGSDPLETFGDLAGEIAAFLCRVTRSDGRPDVSIEPVTSADFGGSQNAVSTWYVVPDGHTSGMLLYVHRFKGTDADSARELFFAALKLLEIHGSGDGDGERLVAFHHTIDCGFILTGRGDEFESLGSWHDDDIEAEIAPTPWDDVLKAIRRGQHEEALRRCGQVVAEQPWHRNAYVAGAVLATFLGRPLAAEDFALVGSKYFPTDSVLHYELGLARMKQDRSEQARKSVSKALEIEPGFTAARFMLVLMHVDAGDYGAARELLNTRSGAPDDQRADASLSRLAQWLRWRTVMVMGGGASVVLGTAATVVGGLLGLIPTVLGIAMIIGGSFGFKAQVQRLVARQGFDEVSEGLRRLNRRPRRGKQEVC